MKWYRNGREIESNQNNYKTEYNVDSGLASLTIKKISKENEGRFTCVARNEIGSCSTSALITVIGSYLFIDSINYLHAHSCYSLSTALPFVGIPPKNVLSELVIQPTEEKISHYPSSYQQSSSTLFLSKTITQTPVVEERTVKTSSITTKVPINTVEPKTIKEPPRRPLKSEIHVKQPLSTIFSENQSADYTKKSNNLFPPRVAPKLPTIIRRSEGEPIKLEVNIIGNPVPEVFWYKDGTLLKNTPDTRLTSDVTPEKDVHALFIPEIFPEDSGVYKIIARNVLGVDESGCRLIVEGYFCLFCMLRFYCPQIN